MYTTPKSYLELLKLFTALLEKKHMEADAAIQRLEGGVLKLAESAEAVANLEENLKVVRHSFVSERISGLWPAALKQSPARSPLRLTFYMHEAVLQAGIHEQPDSLVRNIRA